MEAIEISIFCECVCIAIPCNTAFGKIKAKSVANICVDRLFSTVCLPESQSTLEAIEVNIFCECVCLSISCTTVFGKFKA